MVCSTLDDYWVSSLLCSGDGFDLLFTVCWRHVGSVVYSALLGVLYSSWIGIGSVSYSELDMGWICCLQLTKNSC